METFALTCTTCKTRLKVRDSGAIGQIMACPKCGGMVLVKPPEGPAASASSDGGETRPDLSSQLRPVPLPAASAPLKSDAFDAIDELLGNVPARTMVPTPTARVTAAHPAGQPIARMEPPMGTPPTIIRPAEQKKSPDSQAKTVSQDDIAVAKAAPPLVPTPAKPAATKTSTPASRAAVFTPLAAATLVSGADVAPQTSSAEAGAYPVEFGEPDPALTSNPWQFWAIVGGSGLVGVALAVGVVVISMLWFSKPTAPVVPPMAQVPVEQTPAEQAPVEQLPATIAENHANSPPAVKPPGTLVENAAASVDPQPPVEPQDAGPAAVAPLPKPPMPDRDPLGLTEPVAPAKPALPASDPLKQFDQFIGGAEENPLPAAPQPATKPALPPLDEEPANSPTSPLLPKPSARHVDVAARLADPLPAIDISATPLADFLQVMQDLSTVPITLRPDGLGMIKLTPFSAETPVTWQGKGTTVLEAIQAAVAPLGLETRVEADQLVIDIASPQLAAIKMAVKDLTGGDEQRAGELAAHLQALVAPESWREDDTGPNITVSKDELLIKQHRQALAECVLVLEKLRLARGLKPQSQFDKKLFELATRSQKAQAALATPITLNYSQPTPMLRVLERLGKTANVRILVDWQALSSANWNPAGEVTLTAEKQTLAKTLDDLTQRMELAWRIVDARTLQVTSALSVADRPEFELYSLGDKIQDDAAGTELVARLRTALGNQHFRDAGGRGELRFDLAGKCLLVTLPQPQQQHLAALLAK